MHISKQNTIIGIVGAGTMGAGIALTALYHGFPVILQDSFPNALDNARAYLSKFLAKKGLEENFGLVTFTEEIDGLSGAHIVIEAVIEDLGLKQEIFAALDTVCPAPAILATNTSTLPVTAIASAVSSPQRVAGMHFFNPAPLLPLVEVVRGAQSAPETVDTLAALAEAWGKTPVVTGDTPGFIVNRVARPFYGEALRLLGERVAGHEDIDRLAEQGAGFRMGPFRLMDLIGIDINATAMRSMYEQTFGEPRYRPHWIQMQKMQAGTLGRKTGRGFYEYGEPDVVPDEAQEAPQPATGFVLLSEGSWGPGIGDVIAQRGYRVHTVLDEAAVPLCGLVTAGRDERLEQLVALYDRDLDPAVPLLVQTVETSLSEVMAWVEHPERVVGVDGLFFASGEAAALASRSDLDAGVKSRVEDFISSLGKNPVWIKDSPGMVLPRIICMLTNEAAFAHLEGVGDADTIDLAMRLGVNYPAGPLAWGKQIGYRKVVSVLDHLRQEYGEDRYRACVLLRQWARVESRQDKVK